MRAVLQRVSAARVTVREDVVGAIGPGLLVLVGVAGEDSVTDADWLIDKLLNLRVFEDESGKFNRSLRDVKGELLLISQFTLLADCRKGRRPSFSAAARPQQAITLYEHSVARARAHGVQVATGRFGARMKVELMTDGPLTVILDSRDR